MVGRLKEASIEYVVATAEAKSQRGEVCITVRYEGNHPHTLLIWDGVFGGACIPWGLVRSFGATLQKAFHEHTAPSRFSNAIGGVIKALEMDGQAGE